jgi:hypothetical protein
VHTSYVHHGRQGSGCPGLKVVHMALTVKCPLCGEVITGADEDALVAGADQHGDSKHNGMKAPRAMVIGAARPAD